MKTLVLFTPKGRTQIVLHPETDGEQAIVNLMRTEIYRKGPPTVNIHFSEFVETQGGFYRTGVDTVDAIIVLTPPVEETGYPVAANSVDK
jgi:hypothetical protein